jgi:hypothetical protein
MSSGGFHALRDPWHEDQGLLHRMRDAHDISTLQNQRTYYVP